MKPTTPKWLVLLHQLPTRPSNARVKTWRRLQQIGAVPLRSSAYVLPNSAQAREDFEWMKSEIVAMGGQANVLRADSLDARGDEEIVATCRAARDRDYQALLARMAAAERRARPGARSGARGSSPALRRAIRACRDRFAEIVTVDFFPPPAREVAEAALVRIETKAPGPRAADGRDDQAPALDSRDYRGRTWVTRSAPGVDRMASAWLIRAFIDPRAVFVFRDKPAAQLVPFDMYEGDFSHHAGLCTFEVVANRFGLADPAVRRIGEIVHDLDVKDERYQPPEAATVGALVDGLRALNTDDGTKLQRGIDMFQALYRSMAVPISLVARPRATGRPARTKRSTTPRIRG